MDRLERVVQLHRLFTANRMGLTTARLLQLMGCARSTLYMALKVLGEELCAPLVNDGKRPCTWRYEAQEQAGVPLPGLWLAPDQLYAFLLVDQILKRSGGSLMADAMARIGPRLRRWAGEHAQELDRLRVLPSRARRMDAGVFRIVTTATLERRQLQFTYRARTSGAVSERLVSPQRLTHYQDNWYLEAFEPAVPGLRTFSIDLIRLPYIHNHRAEDLPTAELDAQLNRVYGKVTGPVAGIARIWFSTHATRWIQDEEWHPDQQQFPNPDGSMVLELPYAKPDELLGHVLSRGPHARVLGPPELVEQMKALLRETVRGYEGA